MAFRAVRYYKYHCFEVKFMNLIFKLEQLCVKVNIC
jgi:hypothetical protein